jgi:hypothetical protein
MVQRLYIASLALSCLLWLVKAQQEALSVSSFEGTWIGACSMNSAINALGQQTCLEVGLCTALLLCVLQQVGIAAHPSCISILTLWNHAMPSQQLVAHKPYCHFLRVVLQ